MNNTFMNEFIDELLAIKDKKQMLDFIEGILTEKEIAEISTRLRIVKMLKAGISQHIIAETLKVGIATVTRGSEEIQKGRFKEVKPYGGK